MSTRKGIISIVFGSLISIIGSLFQFVLMFLLIRFYGAKFNGFIKNVMEIVAFLGSTESGIGIMCAIMLFEPLAKKNWFTVNELVSTAHRQNRILSLISLGILVGIAIFYNLYVYFLQSGVDVTITGADNWTLNYGYLILLVMLVGAKNLLSLAVTGSYESLMVADQNNYVRKMIFLICDLLIYSLVFYLIILHVSPAIIFLPFLIHSLIKIVLIKIFVKRRYPWLKINQKLFNFQLVRMSLAVSLKGLGQALLVNVDLIIISLVLNLSVASMISLYMTISVGVRQIMLILINSFREFFATLIVKNGRVNWNSYRKFEIYAYMIGAFAFVNQFVSSPYFINALYANQILESNGSDLRNNLNFLNAYKTVFLQPTFSLLIAFRTVILVISEPIDVLVYGKGYYKKTAKWDFGFGIFNVIMCLAIGFILHAITEDAVATLYAIISVNLSIALFRYLYFWTFNRLYLTYDSSFKGFLKSFLVLATPIIISIFVVYFYLFPSNYWSYQLDPNNVNVASMVLTWTFSKLIAFFMVIISTSAGVILIVSFLFAPKLVLGILRRLPVVYYLNQTIFKKHAIHRELFEEESKGELLSSKSNQKKEVLQFLSLPEVGGVYKLTANNKNRANKD